jgi:hypothetical protein
MVVGEQGQQTQDCDDFELQLLMAHALRQRVERKEEDADADHGGEQHDCGHHVQRITLMWTADECRDVVRSRLVQSIGHYFYP